MEEISFCFERKRGIVWVCDIENSSQSLNDDKTVSSLEAFLPRFHWLARLVVDAAEGQFIKWTGDGFLAWFPVSLHRNLGQKAAAVFNAAWHLTVLVNTTQLLIDSIRPYKIRHGVSFEQDALITKIKDGSSESIDLMGRAVVLAFRLSGIKAPFPGIATQEVLAVAAKDNCAKINFKQCRLTRKEILQYFKGEDWGTSSVFLSSDEYPKGRTEQSVLDASRKVIAAATFTKGRHDSKEELAFASNLIKAMHSGPDWCKNTLAEYLRFIREELLESLKNAVEFLEKR